MKGFSAVEILFAVKDAENLCLTDFLYQNPPSSGTQSRSSHHHRRSRGRSDRHRTRRRSGRHRSNRRRS